MAATLAPISAILDTYANGLRDHAVSAVCALFRRYLSVEESFLSQPSTDQAMAALVKANADSLDGVVATAIAAKASQAEKAGHGEAQGRPSQATLAMASDVSSRAIPR